MEGCYSKQDGKQQSQHKTQGGNVIYLLGGNLSSTSEFLTPKGTASSVLTSHHQQFERLTCSHLHKSDSSLWVRPLSASVQGWVPGVATPNDSPLCLDVVSFSFLDFYCCNWIFKIFLFLWRFEQPSLFLFRVSVAAADFGTCSSFVSFVILCIRIRTKKLFLTDAGTTCALAIIANSFIFCFCKITHFTMKVRMCHCANTVGGGVHHSILGNTNTLHLLFECWKLNEDHL